MNKRSDDNGKRTFFIVLAISLVYLASFNGIYLNGGDQRRTVSDIQRAGGTVYYEFEFPPKDSWMWPGHLPPSKPPPPYSYGFVDYSETNLWVDEPTPFQRLAHNVFGIDSLSPVVAVHLRPSPDFTAEEQLAFLERLPKLQNIFVSHWYGELRQTWKIPPDFAEGEFAEPATEFIRQALTYSKETPIVGEPIEVISKSGKRIELIKVTTIIESSKESSERVVFKYLFNGSEVVPDNVDATQFTIDGAEYFAFYE